MNNWQSVKLSDITELVTERVSSDTLTLHNYISTENMLQDKNGITTASNMPSTGQAISYSAGDILISNIRPYFKKIWLADKNGGASNDVLVFRANKTDKKYLYYILSADDFFNYVMTGSKGTKMPRGDKEQIMQYSVSLPPLPEQKSIAAVLGSLDDKIEANRKENQTLEAIAAALFKSWFVDFEPFGGKRPNKWEMRKISEYIEVKDGTHDSPKQVENGCKLITSKHLNTWDIKLDDAYYISEDDFININKRSKVDTHDILLSMIGTVGIINYVLYDNIDFAIKNIALFKTSDNLNLAEYILFYLKSSYGKSFFLRNVTGSTQVFIGLNELRNMPILMPTVDIISKYKEIVLPIIENICNIQEQFYTLASIRNTLLPRLLSGKLRVKDK
jgi:type I restriction enzyme S subunit